MSGLPCLRLGAGPPGATLVIACAETGTSHLLAMSGLHGAFSRLVKDFAADQNTLSQKFYRIINEVPTALMILIVILVIVKPF